MTGRGHRLTGLGAAFIAAAIARASNQPELFELVAAAIAMVSTTMPDWIEIPFYRNGMRVGSLITHRTLTHWPPLWLACITWGIYDGTLIGAAALGAAVGSLVHILGDCPNPMGIPWLVPHKRIRLGKKGLWRSGEHEFLLIIAFAAVGFGSWYVAGGRQYLG